MADPKALFETLAINDVNYVVVGKVGAALRGVPVLAHSTEVCVYYSRENSEKTAQALRDLNGQIELEHGTVNTPISGDMLETAWRDLPAGRGHRFVTDAGLVDVIYEPKGMYN